MIIRRKQTGQSLSMKCPSNKKIFVRKIRFYHSSCCPPLAKNAISEMCNGRQSCTVKVEKSIELAGCKKHVMYVTLKYKCVDLRDDTSYSKARRCSSWHFVVITSIIYFPDLSIIKNISYISVHNISTKKLHYNIWMSDYLILMWTSQYYIMIAHSVIM